MNFGGWFRSLIEAILFLLVAVSPWYFGAVEPIHRAFVLLGIASIAFLTGSIWLIGYRPAPTACVFSILLLLLIALNAAQLIPLPLSIQKAVSPELVRVRDELLPVDREVFEGRSTPLNPGPGPWQPLSLYPSATRAFVIELLALLTVFTATRQIVASPHALRRFGWGCMFVGAALSVFAIIQRQSSPADLLYWTYQVSSQVFGPFVNRNHFVDFAALCLGAGMILFARPRRNPSPFSEVYESVASPPLWTDGRFLWISFLSATMLTACFFSMSRGGVLAMVVSTLVTMGLIMATRPTLRVRLGAILVALILALLLSLILGTIAVESRIASLWKGDDWRSRLQIWSDVIPHLKAFAIIGSGGGTFEFVEPMYSTQPPEGEVKISEHAHNEYIEAAFEGGLPRLILTTAMALLPTVIAFRRLRERRLRSESIVATLGMTWGLNVVALHSIVEFGIRVPAVACLAAIVAGHLTAITNSAEERPVLTSTRSARVARWLATLGAWSLVPLLVLEGLTSGLADYYRQAALQWAKHSGEGSARRTLEYWSAATRLRPDDAVLHQRAGQAYLDRHAVVEEAERDLLIETGLRHLVISRDLCPNLAQPHVRLGEWRHRLARGDDAVRYFERAVRVLPDEHELWFALGRAYLSAGNHAESQSIWQHYLLRSRKRLKTVLKLGAEAWGETALRDKVLPPMPSVWREAATILHPDANDENARRPYLERAESLLAAKSQRTAQDWLDLATIQSQLGRIDEAIASFRAAIEIAPDRRSAYAALVNLLRRHQRFGEARAVLRDWQARFPNDETAANLIRVVEREILLHEP